MAKQSGVPSKVQVDDAGGTLRDISCDIGTFTIGTPRNMQDVTGLCKSAIERLVLLADGMVEMTGFFNPAANLSHDTLKSVTSSQAIRTVTIDLPIAGAIGTGGPRISMEMLFDDYRVTRGQDGSLSWSTTARLADGTVPSWTTTP